MKTEIDNPTTIYKDIEAKGYNAIVELKTYGEYERTFLEFKEKNNRNIGALDNVDKDKLGKIASAFSNFDGGILIWGIRARVEDGVDKITDLKPINELRKFRTNIMNILKQKLIPPNPYIEFSEIYENDDGNTDKGYLICLIPESEEAPHGYSPNRRKCPDCNRNFNYENNRGYYRRSSDSTIELTHSELRYLFERTNRPKLKVIYNYGKVRQLGNNRFKLRINISVKNISRVMAKYPHLRIKCTRPLEVTESGIDGTRNNYNIRRLLQVEQTYIEEGAVFAGGINDVIYPYGVLDICILEFGGPYTNVPSKLPSIKFVTEAYAENYVGKQQMFDLPKEEILQHIKKNVC